MHQRLEADQSAGEHRPTHQRSEGIGSGCRRLGGRVNVSILGGKLLVDQFSQQWHQRRIDGSWKQKTIENLPSSEISHSLADSKANAKVWHSKVKQTGNHWHQKCTHSDDRQCRCDQKPTGRRVQKRLERLNQVRKQFRYRYCSEM